MLQRLEQVAFTPKGGCPLKPRDLDLNLNHFDLRSIHPQGWVPVETRTASTQCAPASPIAFTPKGGCPLKPSLLSCKTDHASYSIHPQGWVPVETVHHGLPPVNCFCNSIHPQGWVPVETWINTMPCGTRSSDSIHPQGWVPVETIMPRISARLEP